MSVANHGPHFGVLATFPQHLIETCEPTSLLGHNMFAAACNSLPNVFRCCVPRQRRIRLDTVDEDWFRPVRHVRQWMNGKIADALQMTTRDRLPPHAPINNASSDHRNTDELNPSKGNNENCVNCKDCINCQNCVSCDRCKNCHNCTACIDCTSCENCKGCTRCTSCQNSTACEDCVDCQNCTSCIDCTDCQNCVGLKGVTGGRNQSV